MCLTRAYETQRVHTSSRHHHTREKRVYIYTMRRRNTNAPESRFPVEVLLLVREPLDVRSGLQRVGVARVAAVLRPFFAGEGAQHLQGIDNELFDARVFPRFLRGLPRPLPPPSRILFRIPTTSALCIAGSSFRSAWRRRCLESRVIAVARRFRVERGRRPRSGKEGTLGWWPRGPRSREIAPAATSIAE